jgi:hypothetical protein
MDAMRRLELEIAAVGLLATAMVAYWWFGY